MFLLKLCFETTTGPLGQGVANAVGMALGEKLLSQRYNTPETKVIVLKALLLWFEGI